MASIKNDLLEAIHAMKRAGARVETISMPRRELDRLVDECVIEMSYTGLNNAFVHRAPGSSIKFMGIEIKERTS